jgi:hypothetical protein
MIIFINGFVLVLHYFFLCSSAKIINSDGFVIPNITENSETAIPDSSLRVEWSLFSSVAPKSWQNHYVSEHRFNIFVPGSPNALKKYPLIIFFSGFQAEQPSSTYGDLLGEIAMKGTGAVVVAWSGGSFNTQKSFEDFMPFYELLKNGTVQEYINNNFDRPANYSTEKLFIAAHSAGNRLSILLSQQVPSLGMILIDPVDVDPLNIFPPVIHGSVNYSNPILLFATELGEKRGLPFFPPCVSFGSSLKFFNCFSSSSQKFMFNIQNYGHADFLSPDWLAFLVRFSYFCASVKDAELHPRQDFRDFLSGASSAFIGYYGEGIDTFSHYLTNTSKSNIAVNLTMIPRL